MSIFNDATAMCPNCGETVAISWAASLNADRRPDLRAEVLDGSFQAEKCPTCGTQMRLPSHLTYVDMARRTWVLVENPDQIGDWQAHEKEAQNLFEESFGPGAPEAARELADGVAPRLVYGWPALREKIICNTLGLEDVTLELLKMAVIRSGPGAPLGNIALRLVRGDDATLVLQATDDGTEEVTGEIEVPRTLFDDIVGDTEAWAPLRDKLSGVALVDVKRLTLVGA
jgi:predicted RNA-binding Zn-ribbon protein involved in translation (DUF1610 family)